MRSIDGFYDFIYRVEYISHQWTCHLRVDSSTVRPSIVILENKTYNGSLVSILKLGTNGCFEKLGKSCLCIICTTVGCLSILFYFFSVRLLTVLSCHSDFFIPATTANELRLQRIFYPRFYPLHLFLILDDFKKIRKVAI